MDIETFRAYCLSFAGTHDDFPFGKATSDYDRNLLVFYVADKWFCFVNAVECDFCNLRCDPARSEELQERYEGIGPGWHMNKRHWISVRFDSDVPGTLLRELVRTSYELAVARLTRRQRMELTGGDVPSAGTGGDAVPPAASGKADTAEVRRHPATGCNDAPSDGGDAARGSKPGRGTAPTASGAEGPGLQMSGNDRD